jgi:hypothetical protein
MEELKEQILELLAANGATLKAEGADGICLTATDGECDYFYFKQADEYGFDV